MKVNMTFEFKDGLTVNQESEFGHDAKSDIFYGLSQGFKNNAEIQATGKNGELLLANYNDVKSIKISF